MVLGGMSGPALIFAQRSYLEDMGANVVWRPELSVLKRSARMRIQLSRRSIQVSKSSRRSRLNWWRIELILTGKAMFGHNSKGLIGSQPG